MVAHFLQLFEDGIECKERGGPDRCPNCGSYRVAGNEEIDFDERTVTRSPRLCEACEWREAYEPEPLGPPPPAPESPEGDCIPPVAS